MLDAILQRGDSSRLYQSLVYRQQLAAEAGSDFDVHVDPGAYTLYAIVSAGKSPDDVLAALHAEIAKIRDNPVSPAELDKARTELLSDALRERETSAGRAAELARSVIVFHDPDASDKQLAQLQTVTAADVQRVARDILNDARSVTIRYLPAGTGAKGDTIADASTIQPTSIDIPQAEIPTFVLAPPDQRQQPPPPGPPVAAKVPVATEQTLPNGLRVIVAQRPALPLVAANLGIAAGDALDPSDRAGLAEMTAQLTTRGTATRSASDIASEVEGLGASLDAGSTADSSNLSVVTIASKAPQVLGVLADVAMHPAFQQQELERARHETLDNLRLSLRQPSSVARYAMRRRLFGDGPYGRTPSPHSIQAISRDDTAGFHQRWWRPDNAVLVISGDVTPEQGFKLARDALGAWARPAAAMPDRGDAAESVRPAQRPLVIDIPQIGQAAVLLGVVGPSRNAPDYFATLLANDVLGGGYSSRLMEEIRIKRGLSYNAVSQFPPRRFGAPIVAGAQTRNDAVAQVVALMSSELTRLGATEIPADELADRKATLIGSFGRSVETVGGLAGRLSELARFGLPPAKLQSYSADIQAVTPRQATAAARAHFDPADDSLVVVGDARIFGKALKAKYPRLQTIGIDQLNLDSATLQ